MKKLTQLKDSLLTIKYLPNGEEITENPPRFTWMPESREDIPYRLELSKSQEFTTEDTEVFADIPYNFYTLDHILAPGQYYWRYALNEGSEYSQVRSFTVAAGLAETPLKGRKERYQGVEMSHPRIWLSGDKLQKFQKELKKDRNYCGFQDFYNQAVLTSLKAGLVSEPKPYPNHQKVVALWRQNYSDCQKALGYIRSLSVAGVLLEDQQLLNQAKEALLQVAGWDVEGPTSRDYNDECSFRVVYALAFGYDWLYHQLTETERKYVFDKLYRRTKQVADHVMINSRIHVSLYDSHAVRSISSVLTPCSIAMLGESEDAANWLDYTIEYFNVIYTPWGGMDGGWAEGPMYWTTGMAFVIEALNTIKSFMGIDIYQRPFFKKTGDFPLYCNPVDTYRASFCDQSNIGKYPGHKTAFNMRQFAGVTGNGDYYKYYQDVFEREPEIDKSFFNSGWWDFAFDEMVYRHDYGQIEMSKAGRRSLVKWFTDIGWVAINKNPDDAENHIFFLTKSSPYGCVSHSHGDQNDFLIFAYGEPLAARSGYYVGFNTSMHRKWRRQSKSHNVLLIDGKGQYAEMDKARQLSATGQICQVEEQDGRVYIREDATCAYRENVPELKEYIREIYFIDEEYFVIVDTVEAETEVALNWRMHSLFPYQIESDGFTTAGEKAKLSGRFLYCSSDIKEIVRGQGFEGVDSQEIEGLAEHYHIQMNTKKAKSHVIVTLLVPSKVDEERIVLPIKDDQGHDVFIYFAQGEKTFSLRIDGSKRY